MHIQFQLSILTTILLPPFPPLLSISHTLLAATTTSKLPPYNFQLTFPLRFASIQVKLNLSVIRSYIHFLLFCVMYFSRQFYLPELLGHLQMP